MLRQQLVIFANEKLIRGISVQSPNENEIRLEAIDVVRSGLKRGVDDVISHALSQWLEHGYGLDEEKADEHRRRWLEIRNQAHLVVTRLEEVLAELKTEVVGPRKSKR